MANAGHGREIHADECECGTCLAIKEATARVASVAHRVDVLTIAWKKLSEYFGDQFDPCDMVAVADFLSGDSVQGDAPTIAIQYTLNEDSEDDDNDSE